MNQEQVNQPTSDQSQPKKHLSPWIAWSIVILVAGVTGFAVWYYWNQIDTIASNINITAIKKTSTDKTKTATTTTTPTADTSATADWKTYTNDKYGFSVKHPEDVVPKEYTDTISFSPDNGNGKWVFGVSNEGSTSTVSELVTAKKAELDAYYGSVIVTDITVDGKQAKKIVRSNPKGDDDTGNTLIFVENNSKNVLQISSDSSYANFATILSTFQFSPVK